jgi:myo-inositol-1(or 4)-monophosphatase
VAAGLLIAKEAGAIVQPIREGQNLVEDGQVLAAAEPIFDQFAKIIRDRSEI